MVAKNPRSSVFWTDTARKRKGICSSLPDVTWPLKDALIVRKSFINYNCNHCAHNIYYVFLL